MNFFGFFIIKRGTIFIMRAGDAKHKIKFQWPNNNYKLFQTCLKLYVEGFILEATIEANSHSS